MTRITLRIEGEAQLARALEQYGAKAEREIDRAVNATGLELRGEVVKKYQRGPATGRIYKKSNPERTHQASRAGEAPATDTGRLASSVDFKREGRMAASVGSSLAYAAYLEFGTGNIDPRPAWVPATEAMRPKFNLRIRAAIERAAR